MIRTITWACAKYVFAPGLFFSILALTNIDYLNRKVILTFNYSGDDRIMTLHEIDGGLGHSIRIPSAIVHQEKHHPDGWCFLLFAVEFIGAGPASIGPAGGA